MGNGFQDLPSGKSVPTGKQIRYGSQFNSITLSSKNGRLN